MAGTTTKQEQRLTKQERVHREVRERILSGAYGPGFRVVIDALAQEFQVSALPVREAIRRLEAEGLVVYRPNAGAQVSPADPGLFEQEMIVLAVLEGFATAVAGPNLDKDAIGQLKAINTNMVDAMETLDSLNFGRLNQEFHALIYRYCDNEALLGRIRDVARRLDAIRRTVFVQIPYRGAASVSEHNALIQLIVDRATAAEIEAAARDHKLATIQSFRSWRVTHST